MDRNMATYDQLGSLKRRRSSMSEQESKKPRADSGKSSPSTSPTNAQRVQAVDNDTTNSEDNPAAGRDAWRKSSSLNEKARFKRLFGPLLSLDKPGQSNPSLRKNSGANDRVASKQLQIEKKRKAELQRQDDERHEINQKRLKQLAEHRKKQQIKVDAENMTTRHENLMYMAKHLKTQTEPPLYYLPWELRPEEEAQIAKQITIANEQIDYELKGVERRLHDDLVEAKYLKTKTEPPLVREESPGSAGPSLPSPKQYYRPWEMVPEQEAQIAKQVKEVRAEIELEVGGLTRDFHDDVDQAIAYLEDEDPDQERASPKPASRREHAEQTDDYGDHVEEGDEDTVIY